MAGGQNCYSRVQIPPTPASLTIKIMYKKKKLARKKHAKKAGKKIGFIRHK
jgi:hypothetical protein